MDINERLPGLFIVVEGMEASGKTTTIKRLKERLEAQGHEVLVTRQPGGTPIAESIRNVLKDPHLGNCGEAFDSFTEYMLFSAARYQAYVSLVQPALKRGAIVISDRGALSSYAYQQKHVRSIHDLCARTPDYTVYLDAPLKTCLERMAERGESCRIEQKGERYLSDVYERYKIGIQCQTMNNGTILRLRTATFDETYDRQVERTAKLIGSAMDVRKSGPNVTVAEFEQQVLKVEGVRIIVRADSTICVMPYCYDPIRDHGNILLLNERLYKCLHGLPYVLVSKSKGDPSSTDINDYRQPQSKQGTECLAQ